MEGMFSKLKMKRESKSENHGYDEGVAVIPVPKPNAFDIPTDRRFGSPLYVWDYFDEHGNLLFKICRFQNGEQKETRPFTFRRFSDGHSRWFSKAMEAPRPLYRLPDLLARVEAPVLICEGEKAADAAQKIFSEYIVITSSQGANGYNQTDWSRLAGRKVTIWPDNDQAGKIYAENVSQILKSHEVLSSRIVSIPDDFPEKWDLADEIPDGYNSESLEELLTDAEIEEDLLLNLVARAAANPGLCFQKDILPALRDLQRNDLPSYENLRNELKQAKVRVTELDKHLAKLDKFFEPEPDHLDLAKDIDSNNGVGNLLATAAHVWRWKDSGVWKPIPMIELKNLVQTYLDEIKEEVSRGIVESVADVLRSHVYSEDHEWNHNRNIVNVLNGKLLWDGREWVLKEHLREDFNTTQIPIVFDKLATCPRFEQFLSEIFEGDLDKDSKSKVLLEMMGYTLQSHAQFEKFIILVGSGANGKSVLMEIIRLLVGGENASGVQPSQFSNRFQRAHLNLKLANLITEVSQGADLDDAEFKAIVSGESMTAEHKNQHPFDFKPFCTIWLGTNHMPGTKDFSKAIFRRAIVLPFNKTFKLGENADPLLKDKLEQELPGILNMVLNAYGEVLNGKAFAEPESCLAAKDEWQKQSNPVLQFIEDECLISSTLNINFSALYGAYCAWAIEEGLEIKLTSKQFSQRMELAGFTRFKGAQGVRKIRGISLRNFGGGSGG